MANTKEAGYGAIVARATTQPTLGKTFYVTDAIGTGKTAAFMQDVFTQDNDGVLRVYSSITTALAATVAGRNDVIVIAADYTTAPTDAELATAGTNGVKIVFSDFQTLSDEQIAMTTNKALPATTSGALFNVVGVCELISIIGVVTTVIQTQTCNAKLQTVSNAATTDICADLDITAKTAQSRMSITGTFANAMINTAKGVPVARQATSIVVQEGTINLNTSATNTGNIRWFVRYKPLQHGSRIYAA